MKTLEVHGPPTGGSSAEQDAKPEPLYPAHARLDTAHWLREHDAEGKATVRHDHTPESGVGLPTDDELRIAQLEERLTVAHARTATVEQRLEEARHTVSVMHDALDHLWSRLYSGQTDWAYPGQVAAHALQAIADERKVTEAAKARLEELRRAAAGFLDDLALAMPETHGAARRLAAHDRLHEALR